MTTEQPVYLRDVLPGEIKITKDDFLEIKGRISYGEKQPLSKVITFDVDQNMTTKELESTHNIRYLGNFWIPEDKSPLPVFLQLVRIEE